MTSKPGRGHRETDLDAPVRYFLETQGFTVRAEVDNCDIVATRNEEIVVVELKLNFSVDLLAQACDRQRITPSVYVAVPKSIYRARSRKWRRNRLLLRRLEIGLLAVDLDSQSPTVRIVLQPIPYQRQSSSKRKRAVLQEIAGRSNTRNEGGSVRRKLVTAYREQAIFIATALTDLGTMSPKQLKELGAVKKTGSILYSNFYGWFDRVGHGLYAINEKGKEDLESYNDLVKDCRERIRRGD